MKKIIRINESKLIRLIKNIILENEEESEPKELSKYEWERIWYKLRRENKSFNHPDIDSAVFSFGGLDFMLSEDGKSLELMEFFRNPKNWGPDYEKGSEVLDRYFERLSKVMKESDLGIKVKMGNNFNIKIIKI